MCTVLGWVQGWWSVSGLGVEITGFTILATDVAREYKRHRMEQRLRTAGEAANRVANAPPELKRRATLHAFNNTLSHEENWKRYLESSELIEKKRHLSYDEFDANIIWWETLNDHERVENNKGKRHPDFQEIGHKLLVHANKLRETPYRRAPLRLGIALVFLGGGLQIIGSWPCT